MCTANWSTSSYKRVKGRSHTVEKRKASHPQKPHATNNWSTSASRNMLQVAANAKEGTEITRSVGQKKRAHSRKAMQLDS